MISYYRLNFILKRKIWKAFEFLQSVRNKKFTISRKLHPFKRS